MRIASIILPLLFAAATLPAAAALYETQEQALKRIFPVPARVVRDEKFLSETQRKRTAKQAGAPVESGHVIRYAGYGADGACLGTAYFDRHAVRTADEVLMIVIAPGGTVRSVDVLAFSEPEDYLPRSGWLKRIEGKGLRDELYVGRGLAHVTGATLTTRAIAATVRRVLALDAELGPVAAPAPLAAPPVQSAPGAN